ncbi:2-oxoglutarate dehydrogenase complex dihydrolipoyllysine-residue succinyltransferase [Candidatus Liberibacter asiaticus]|uniref:Dihydrolipoyllysine-residue succinyltransferase component of 2-oxoglutarate dehydrogenase complex n=3 Tax=Liberibacter asiaticus TaxID=34021 RepID=C6XGM2_LIBAP|nr:dihydrolipoamide succinyltransferase [Candidatus Liberibacter asiaticus str. psy62]AGH17288.1 dihydrolipoamide succinyltransferase [Candidatus Liberibacter asiaticus str. gxpsy]ALK07580.1 2-oxoglutarate dehydrogenase complex dihydrolipoyllysine-residue succinyltransferase [Candidatus Liberibacter asiaticus]BAP26821.1 dihydrolipoamide succinyltransferase [Candidatus Liberibacter asiaticus str. Ishi-1]ASK53071.1 dihydrolipoamide succinyltransferase [Candidatus Liberibacter asiaticus]
MLTGIINNTGILEEKVRSMATKILVPSLGESVNEATVGTWLKEIGESVEIGEILVELETDKVTVEVPSPVSGKLHEMSVAKGDTVTYGGFLGYIVEIARDEDESIKQNSPNSTANGLPEITDQGFQMPHSPSASKLIAESGLSPSDIKGTGKRGQILKSDVMAAISRSESSVDQSTVDSHKKGVFSRIINSASNIFEKSSVSEELSEERVKMSRLRQTVAKRLKDAQNTAAILSTYNEVNMSRIISIRSRYKDIFEKKHGIKLGFMGFFTKAASHVLQEIKGVNAEIDGDHIVYKNYCHIGVAVGTDKGLVVPVIRHADKMNIVEIEREIARLGREARAGHLSMRDLQNGTFTISNGGVYGSLLSSPILNPPQSGILGMHKIQERPIVEDGQIVIRPMMYLALSYDHRIVDGKEAVTFLVRLKELLEDPERFILDL